MADIVDSATRSRMMSGVRSTNNHSTELRLRALLRANRLSGWRRHLDLPGKPDFAWPADKVAVFVDGCFWHGCPKCYRAPKSNAVFWKCKIDTNRQRDRRVNRQLRAGNWKVVRIWECRVGQHSELARIARALSIELG